MPLKRVKKKKPFKHLMTFCANLFYLLLHLNLSSISGGKFALCIFLSKTMLLNISLLIMVRSLFFFLLFFDSCFILYSKSVRFIFASFSQYSFWSLLSFHMVCGVHAFHQVAFLLSNLSAVFFFTQTNKKKNVRTHVRWPKLVGGYGYCGLKTQKCSFSEL